MGYMCVTRFICKRILFVLAVVACVVLLSIASSSTYVVYNVTHFTN